MPMNSSPILSLDSKSIWHPFSALRGDFPVMEIVSSEGEWLVDNEGNRYVDAISSWWTNIHGHRRPELRATILETLENFDHLCFAGITHAPATRLAVNLLETAGGHWERVFYSDNGSTATEVAIKLAHQYHYLQGTHHKRLLALRGAYHGDTLGAMSLSERGVFTEAFRHLLIPGVFYLPSPCGEADLEDVDRLLNEESIGIMIYEPLVQGASGMVMHDPWVLAKMLKRVQDHGAILIADEVMTGFYRTGEFLASHHQALRETGVVPDLVCLSKAISGGVLPLGATLCSSRIVEAFRSSSLQRTFFHGHSYTGNPLSCALGHTSLELLKSPEEERRRKEMMNFLRDLYLELSSYGNSHGSSHSPFHNLRLQGGILAMECPGKTRHELYHYFTSQGVFLRPLGHTVYVMPPYTLSPEGMAVIRRSFLSGLKTLNQ